MVLKRANLLLTHKKKSSCCSEAESSMEVFFTVDILTCNCRKSRSVFTNRGKWVDLNLAELVPGPVYCVCKLSGHITNSVWPVLFLLGRVYVYCVYWIFISGKSMAVRGVVHRTLYICYSLESAHKVLFVKHRNTFIQLSYFTCMFSTTSNKEFDSQGTTQVLSVYAVAIDFNTTDYSHL